MATTTVVLTNASVAIGAVDLSDQVRSVTLTIGYDQLEVTAMGATGRAYTKGLQSVDVTLEMFNSYGSSEVEPSRHQTPSTRSPARSSPTSRLSWAPSANCPW